MANAQVILKEKIEGLGAEADVVKVRAGYARNFLIPQGKAFEANRSNLRHVEALKASRAAREAEETFAYLKAMGELDGLEIPLTGESPPAEVGGALRPDSSARTNAVGA